MNTATCPNNNNRMQTNMTLFDAETRSIPNLSYPAQDVSQQQHAMKHGLQEAGGLSKVQSQLLAPAYAH